MTEQPGGRGPTRASSSRARRRETRAALMDAIRRLPLGRYAEEHPAFAARLRALCDPVRQNAEALRVRLEALVAPLRAVAEAPAPLQELLAAMWREHEAHLAAIATDLRRAERSRVAAMAREIRRAAAETDREWAAQFPCPRPKSIEDWQALAVRVGCQADFVLKGEWTPGRLMPIVIGYFQRLEDERGARAGQDLSPESSRKTDDGAAADESETAGTDPEFGMPYTDPADRRLVRWFRKRLYLGGEKTHAARVFWLLAKRMNRPVPVYELQRATDGFETSAQAGSNPEEIRQANNRIRKVISRLRAALREHGLDQHVAIVRESERDWPCYMMMYRSRPN